jgi:hypothetical protein
VLLPFIPAEARTFHHRSAVAIANLNLQSEIRFGALAQLVERLNGKDRALLRGQVFFNPVDQLGNIDRLGER